MTENKFDFLLNYLSTKIVEKIVQEDKLSLEAALLEFHNSETFQKLCDEATGMYLEGPAYIYDTYRQEQRLGTIRGLHS